MDWHRLFGLILTDFFADSPYVVEIEKDLSVRKQLLDVVVVRKGPGKFHGTLPDGMDNLAEHNLISFKSHHDKLDGWAVLELLGHYVNYRKQVSLGLPELLPAEDFSLYGVCARFPELLNAEAPLQELQQGVYLCDVHVAQVRVLVLRQLPQEEQNALLCLFSADAKQVEYGRGHYHQHCPDVSTLLQRLLSQYRGEGFSMPYTMQDFKKELRQEVLAELTLEERLSGLPKSDILRAIANASIADVLHERSPEEILQALSPEQRQEIWQKLAGQQANTEDETNGSE